MVNTSFLTTFLKINHLSVDATDAELRAAMKHSHWDPNEIEHTIRVLKDPSVRRELEHKESGMNGESHSPAHTAPVQIPRMPIVAAAAAPMPWGNAIRTMQAVRSDARERGRSRALVARFLITVMCSLVFAALVGLGIAYVQRIGPFYELEPSAALLPGNTR